MALDVVTLGRVSQKRGNPKVVREAVLMGDRRIMRLPLYAAAATRPKEGLRPPSHHSSKCLTLMTSSPQQYRTNQLSIDLAEEALVGQCRSVPLGSPSSAHPPSSPASPGHRSIQRTPPPASAPTCPSSSIDATASSCANRCPGGTGRASTHDCTKN